MKSQHWILFQKSEYVVAVQDSEQCKLQHAKYDMMQSIRSITTKTVVRIAMICMSVCVA